MMLKCIWEIVISRIVLILLLAFPFSACKKNAHLPLYIEGDGVFDTTGNFYPSVIIGNQEWITENLRTDRYANGDLINQSGTQWVWYNNNPDFDSVFGKLYNHDVIESSAEICPCNWHVPTDDEFSALITYLGGNIDAARKLKSRGTLLEGDGLWFTPEENAPEEGNNLSGFNAVPAGEAIVDGSFLYKDSIATFWVSAPTKEYDQSFSLQYNQDYVSIAKFFNTNSSNTSANFFYAVRCIKNY